MTAIKSKLINEAGNFLMTRPDLKTWADIKQALRTKYGDPYSRQNLVQELIYTTRSHNEPIFDYLERLKSLNHRITSKIISDISLTGISNSLIAQNELIPVQNLVTNSPVELRTILMVQNLVNLDLATSFVLNYQMAENHMKFTRQNNPNFTNPGVKPKQNIRPQFQQQVQYRQPPQHYPKPGFQQFWPQPVQQYSSQPIFVPPKINHPHQFPTNSGNFRKPFNHGFDARGT
ncbi:uncharacterized protein [Euwallacea fornicatus]|uniref:uncharacterized protein n=1 Tax=Euwallacea fornicatus TaxID=995702 RepID=UPI00338F4A1E